MNHFYNMVLREDKDISSVHISSTQAVFSKALKLINP